MSTQDPSRNPFEPWKTETKSPPSNVFGIPASLDQPEPEVIGNVSHHNTPPLGAPESLDWTSIVEDLPFGLVVLGPEQEIRHENHFCRALMGCGISETGGIEPWLAELCPDQQHREKVINSWREHIWRNQLTRTFTLKGTDQKVREIEFRSSLLEDGGITLTIQDVTERLRTEDSLRHGKSKFRAIFTHSESGTVLVDTTGRVIDANQAFLKLVGIPLSELRLSTLSDLLHPRDVEEFGEQAPQPNVAGSVSREVWLRTRESELRARLTYCPIGDSTEQPALGIYIFTETSAQEREQLEEQMRMISVKAQALLNSVPDLIVLLDQDDTVVDFAPPQEEWEDLKPSNAWSGKPVSEVFPELGEIVSRTQRQLRQEGKTIHADIRSGDHGNQRFASTVSPCGGGQLLAVVREKAPVVPEEPEQPWKAVAFDRSSQTFLATDASFRIIDANEAASRLFEREPGELIGHKLPELFSEDLDDNKAFRKRLEAVLRLDDAWSSRESIKLHNGETISALCDFVSVPLEDGAPGLLVSVAEIQKAEAHKSYDPVLGREAEQHHFRNQIQLVTSLFSLEPQGAAARDAFLKWQVRLRALANAQPYGNATEVWIVSLLQNLADEVCGLTGLGSGRKEIIITGLDNVAVHLASAPPLSILAAELMRLVVGTRQMGQGPSLICDVKELPSEEIAIRFRPGTGRRFLFTDEDAEMEILQVLAEQLRGRLLTEGGPNTATGWEIIIPK